ncbi:MAG: preprotein translocase subunit SecA [Deferribacterota bacterium]|nr:preprotein translocase subunit SecA [Deferribacterota bacterium]
MIKFIANKIVGSYNNRYLKKLRPLVDKINSLEDEMVNKSNSELMETTKALRKELEAGKSLDELIVPAFAVVREVSKRTIGLRHFDVQLMGGYVLHKGKIAEMKTGEGKTLVATLALYLNALGGKGGHLVTVNDYLARRDALWMGPIYKFLGLDVGVLQHETSYLVEWEDEETFTTKLVEADRRDVYKADIVYGTNSEFGFDYLRDNMKYNLEDYVQRDLNYAIVDEVDNILIDEARTPLIISGPTDETTSFYYKIDKIVRPLKRDVDYTVDEKARQVKLTDSGIDKVEKALGIDNLYDVKNIDTLHFVNNALKAHALFKIDKDYVVKDGKVIIVDEFTGRLMTGRRYSEGLHQALEAKEDVPIENENQTLASITLQNYFRMYKKLAGMTGTAYTEAAEFKEIYNLDVIVIPTHKPMIRKDLPDVIYKTTKEKFDAIVEEIVKLNKQGRPVLVGTVSIEKSEYLSSLLRRKGIKHQVLNAKYHEKEAAIIAEAGKKGAVTIATNMAGRGTDIKLREGVVELGGLHIVGTERHEARRIDNQLRGRSGRQGDPGSSRFYISLEDDLLRIFGSEKISYIMNKIGIKEGEPIEHPMISRAIEGAQKKIESMHFEIRKHLLEYDNVANVQRQVVYSLRRNILEKDDLEPILDEMLGDVISSLSERYIQGQLDQDYKAIKNEIERIFNIKDIELDNVNGKNVNSFNDKLFEKVKDYLKVKKELLGENYTKFLRFIMINILDSKWKDHLLSMDYLRDSVGLRGYGQKDPLIEYKKEAYALFTEMMTRVREEIVSFLCHVELRQESDIRLEERRRSYREEKKDVFNTGQEKEEKKEPVRRRAEKVGRNDPCPCGSGKKYKKCCGSQAKVVGK